MRHIIIYTLMALMAVFILGPANGAAEDRLKKYEMADGHFVWFKMTPEAILAEDAKRARREALRKAVVNEAKKWVVTIELPESGDVLEFPLSDKAIKMAKMADRKTAAKKGAIRMAKPKKDDRFETTVIEMADGNSVTFSASGLHFPEFFLFCLNRFPAFRI